MFKRATWLAALALAITAAGCAGSDGSAGPRGPQGPQGTQGNPGADLTATAKPESCEVCHGGAGGDHQKVYGQFQDASTLTATIDSVQTIGSTARAVFTVKKDGQPYVDQNLAGLNQWRMYAIEYDGAGSFTRQIRFNNPAMIVDGQYVATTDANTAMFAPESSNAVVYGIFAMTPLEGGGEITMYGDTANVAKVYGTVGYTSKANIEGCWSCHGNPFLKEGYRAARVAGLNDFVACKACHYDTKLGGHQAWQFTADDPLYAATTGATLSTAIKNKYPYKLKLMNDVHMSHAMEIAYPQSMANCVTCHQGANLAAVTAPAFFKLETCRSCHPVTGPANRGASQAKYVNGKRAPALISLMTAKTTSFPNGITAHNAFINNLYATGETTTDCTGCHSGGAIPTFAEMHSGRDAQIYDAANGNARYSDEYVVTIDPVTVLTNVLTIQFRATGPDPEQVATIKPTVLVGLYGYDTKDFIVDPHGTAIVNGQSVSKALEYVVGGTTPARFTTVSDTTTGGTRTWTVKADLNDWASLISTGAVSRVEIGVMPTAKLVADPTVTLAVNAPTKTFNLKTGETTSSAQIVDAAKCNKCHDALATTFHSGDRGGNVMVCRLCHNVRSGASHYEGQSRSIDSYVHAIHSFEFADIQNVDWTDPVFKARYAEHVGQGYPLFTTKACESCHFAGTYEVPDNTKSLPGAVSGTKALKAGWDRNVGVLPSYVSGPAARACGGCHRATLIKEDDANGLVSFIGHTDTMGTYIETTSSNAASTLDAAIAKIMGLFK